MVNESVMYEFVETRTTIPIAQARPRLTEILDAIQRQPVTITKDGNPVAVIVDPLWYDSLMVTLEILTNPELKHQLDDYDRREAAGELEWVSHEEVERLIGG